MAVMIDKSNKWTKWNI